LFNMSVGQHVCLTGTGKWHTGRLHFATVVDVEEESIKVRYLDGGYKRFSKQEFQNVLSDIDSKSIDKAVEETFDKFPVAEVHDSKVSTIHESLVAATQIKDARLMETLKVECDQLVEQQGKLNTLRKELSSVLAKQNYQKAHEIQTELNSLMNAKTKETPKDGPTFGEKMSKAGKRALGGGVAGASAMVLQVSTLMWMRTIMNYQYRNGGTFLGSYKQLMSEGGVRRLYSGYVPALLQGPLSRFGDTFANAGVLALFESSETMNNVPTAAKTVFASATAAGMRIFLTPIDTVKTMMQANGKEGIPLLKQKLAKGGPAVMFHGATATMAATFVGHYPFFATFNTLQENIPTPNNFFQKLARNAGIGFASSVVSDTLSNSLRVVKTVRQTNATMSYNEIVTGIVQKEGYAGLFGRGLQTRLVCNGTQGLMFSVVYKYVEQELMKK